LDSDAVEARSHNPNQNKKSKPEKKPLEVAEESDDDDSTEDEEEIDDEVLAR
jgi:hypothetical protein